MATWYNIPSFLNQMMAKLNAIEKGVLMADQALVDLQTAATNLETGVQAAIALITQLKTAPAMVADSDVEAVVTQLNTSMNELKTAVTGP